MVRMMRKESVTVGCTLWVPVALWFPLAMASAASSGCVGDVELFYDDETASPGPSAPPSPPSNGLGGGSGAPMAVPDAVDPVAILPEAASPEASATPSQPAATAPEPAAAADPDAAPEPPAPEPTPAQPERDPTPAQPETDPTGGARVCRAPAAPVLLDFARANDDASQATFGDFASVLSGGTFVYPDAGSTDSPEAPASLGLRSDMSAGDWRISGAVAAQAGFGLFFDCQQLDASRFVGLAFRLEGELPAGALTLVVGSAANEVSRAWLLDSGSASPGPSFGRCTPLGTAFDGSCRAARITLPVRREGDEVLVRFADLADGSPEARLDPAEITSIQWALPPPRTGSDGAAVPYSVDLRLDDIRFIDAE